MDPNASVQNMGPSAISMKTRHKVVSSCGFCFLCRTRKSKSQDMSVGYICPGRWMHLHLFPWAHGGHQMDVTWFDLSATNENHLT